MRNSRRFCQENRPTLLGRTRRGNLTLKLGPVDGRPRPRPKAIPGTRTYRLPWALLLKKAFTVDVLACPDFFGPSQGLQLQPELDVIQGFGDSFRVIAKLEPTFVPSESNATAGVSLYGAWMLAPFMETTITPDIAKRRRLDVRLGVSWYPTTVSGTAGWSNLLQLEGEATVRESIPWQILATLRSRVEAVWQLDEPTSFVWRLRARLQLEREFDFSDRNHTSLTPFANAEVVWTTSQNMWAQFRMQAGLQLGVQWFGKGQVIEVNGSVVTYLQPSRSYSPVIGVVWYQYF